MKARHSRDKEEEKGFLHTLCFIRLGCLKAGKALNTVFLVKIQQSNMHLKSLREG